MSLYSQEKEQEVQVFSLYFEDCFSKKTAMEKSIFHSPGTYKTILNYL